MQQLLLLRHAKSSRDDPGQPDHARPLNAAGRDAAARLRLKLRELGLMPDVVLVSSARRTMQTLEALSPWDETPLIEPMDGLYLAEPKRLFAVVHGVSETVRSLMVVGHNPGLHDFARLLAGIAQAPHEPASAGSRGDVRSRLAAAFPTCALAELTVPGPWRDLAAGGANLVRFLWPPDQADAGA